MDFIFPTNVSESYFKNSIDHLIQMVNDGETFTSDDAAFLINVVLFMEKRHEQFMWDYEKSQREYRNFQKEYTKLQKTVEALQKESEKRRTAGRGAF